MTSDDQMIVLRRLVSTMDDYLAILERDEPVNPEHVADLGKHISQYMRWIQENRIAERERQPRAA